MDTLQVVMVTISVMVLAMAIAFGVFAYARTIKRRDTEVSEQIGEQDARAIDPNNPPTYRVYRPRPGREPICCTCHHEPLVPGDRVLWWPLKDGNGAVDLFCPRTVEEGTK